MTELKKLFLETDVDKLIELIEKKKRLSIKEAARALGEDENVIEDWIRILEEHGYLKISYPVVGSPVIQFGEKKISAAESGEEEESGAFDSEEIESNESEREEAEIRAEKSSKGKKRRPKAAKKTKARAKKRKR